MSSDMTIPRVASVGVLLAAAAIGSALVFSFQLGQTAIAFPEMSGVVAPLTVLGSAFVLCLIVTALIAIRAVRARGPEQVERRLAATRPLIVLTLLLVAIDIAIAAVVLGSGFSPGTLILLYGFAAAGLVAVALLWAYRASHLRPWAR